ncbi:MAG TPA: YHYH protein [Candidatus Saccharimonadales bacterium]|nr:YHYH protein [Candidatus Saccharimonadales bacterium]
MEEKPNDKPAETDINSIEPPDDIKAQIKPEDHPQTPDLPAHAADAPLPQTEQLILPPKSHRQVFIVTGIILLLIAIAITAYFLFKNKENKQAPVASANSSQTARTSQKLTGIQLDTSKNYGNKYANGILPVGDGKYSSSAPAVGTVYACAGYAQNLSGGQGGAGGRGPWFIGTSQYNMNKKIHVQGNKMWQASFSNKLAGATRTITTNDLPNHPTGTFPISAADPAYAYDRNPNAISGQSFTYSLSASPVYAATPNCMGGEAGVMLTGVALFNGFDAGGRDAGAWEVQDSCSGHPQKDGVYHYHTLSSCIKDISVKTVIGFALDGYPITGPQVGTNNILTTSDLDECHGLTSQVVLDGKDVTTYHYVMTQDFPYSVSCFRAQPIQAPGLKAGPAV